MSIVRIGALGGVNNTVHEHSLQKALPDGHGSPAAIRFGALLKCNISRPLKRH